MAKLELNVQEVVSGGASFPAIVTIEGGPPRQNVRVTLGPGAGSSTLSATLDHQGSGSVHFTVALHEKGFVTLLGTAKDDLLTFYLPASATVEVL